MAGFSTVAIRYGPQTTVTGASPLDVFDEWWPPG